MFLKSPRSHNALVYENEVFAIYVKKNVETNKKLINNFYSELYR